MNGQKNPQIDICLCLVLFRKSVMVLISVCPTNTPVYKNRNIKLWIVLPGSTYWELAPIVVM